mmetsp:Transcript_31002/g.50156  ORF Transcript_31002/g.50156 Transcript_31002/m.50156 type:complete len:277 (+) Transcript_31002:433-1263(+)
MLQIERLRNEGLVRRKKQQVEELAEWEKYSQQVKIPDTPVPAALMESTLKVMWEKIGMTYSADTLKAILGIFGEVDTVVVSTRKHDQALVSFKTIDGARKAFQHYSISGREFKVAWAKEKPPDSTAPKPASGSPIPPPVPTSSSTASSSFQFTAGMAPSAASSYESAIMMKLRQAAERQRVIAEIQESDRREAEKKKMAAAAGGNTTTSANTDSPMVQDEKESSSSVNGNTSETKNVDMSDDAAPETDTPADREPSPEYADDRPSVMILGPSGEVL